MKKNIKTNASLSSGRETAQKEDVRAEKSRKASAAERFMLRKINFWSLIIMIVMPLCVDVGLRALKVYVDTFISVYYSSAAVTVLQWVLYYLMLLLTMLYQFGGYGVLGYSIMRYNVQKSICPILLSVAAATIHYLSGIVEIIYLQGINTIRNNLTYLSVYWILNYFLALFTTLCVIFLCAILRIAFIRHGRMQVQISDESREVRKKNVLRRLYLWITGLLLLFNFFPALMNMIAEIKAVGGPEDIWEWITLLQPFAEILLLHALGYFTLLRIGTMLTGLNEKQRLRAEASDGTNIASVPPVRETADHAE